jgi:hypothetical protein
MEKIQKRKRCMSHRQHILELQALMLEAFSPRLQASTMSVLCLPFLSKGLACLLFFYIASLGVHATQLLLALNRVASPIVVDPLRCPSPAKNSRN